MARTAITVQTAAAYGGKIEDATLTAGDATNDMQFTHPGGDVILFVKNGHTSPITVTVVAVASPASRQMATDIALATTNAKESFCVIPDQGYNQGAGVVHLDMTVDTNLSLAVVKATPSP
jgi:hypothetical protein